MQPSINIYKTFKELQRSYCQRSSQRSFKIFKDPKKYFERSPRSFEDLNKIIYICYLLMTQQKLFCMHPVK